MSLMDVYFLEQTELNVPPGNDWLSESEILCLSRLRFAKRHDDWRLGRWTAKRAVALRSGLPASPQMLAKIEIRPAPSGAPTLFFENKPAAATISLSHRDGKAICAVTAAGLELGCDLELIEPHSDGFIVDYFTAEEQLAIAEAPAGDRFCLLALLWSAKESALKALHAGLRLDTRQVIVRLLEASDLNGWRPLRVHSTEGQIFDGWWQRTNDTIRTLVANPSPDLPILLKTPFVLPASDHGAGRRLASVSTSPFAAREFHRDSSNPNLDADLYEVAPYGANCKDSAVRASDDRGL